VCVTLSEESEPFVHLTSGTSANVPLHFVPLRPFSAFAMLRVLHCPKLRVLCSYGGRDETSGRGVTLHSGTGAAVVFQLRTM
jgi:hypothetical protein